MFVYFLILGLVIFLSLINSIVLTRYRIGSNNVNIKNSDIYILVLMFLVLTFFAMFRAYTVGTDAENYSSYFLRIGKSINIFSIIKSAPIYSIYNKIIYFIFPYRQAILIFNAIIILVGIAYFIYNYSEDVCFSTIIYIISYSYCFSFNGMRQCMAMSMVLISFCWLDKNYKIRSIILLLFAIGVHNTAILGALSLWVIKKNVTYKVTKRIFIASLFGMVILKYGYDYIIKMFIIIFPRYSMYLNKDSYSAYTTSQGRNIYVSLFYVSFVILAFFIQKWRITGYYVTQEKQNQINKLLVPCILSTVSGIIWANNFTLGRIREYYTIFFICLIPNLTKVFRRYNLLIKVVVILVLIIPFSIQLKENKSNVVPYIFFWDI